MWPGLMANRPGMGFLRHRFICGVVAPTSGRFVGSGSRVERFAGGRIDERGNRRTSGHDRHRACIGRMGRGTSSQLGCRTNLWDDLGEELRWRRRHSLNVSVSLPFGRCGSGLRPFRISGQRDRLVVPV